MSTAALPPGRILISDRLVAPYEFADTEHLLLPLLAARRPAVATFSIAYFAAVAKLSS